MTQQEIEIPTETEVAAVLDRLGRRNRQLHALAVTALATGARRGELCASTRKDFDAKAGELRIERSLETTAGGLRIKSPKTKHGRRTIGIPAPAVAELQGHWKRQQEERLACGLGRSGPDE